MNTVAVTTDSKTIEMIELSLIHDQAVTRERGGPCEDPAARAVQTEPHRGVATDFENRGTD